MSKHHIPQGWKKSRLADVCVKLKSGGTPSVSKTEYYDGDIPYVKIEDMTSNGEYLCTTKTTITQEGLDNSSAWLIPENSILFSIYASVGEVAINKVKLATNQAIMGIIPDTSKIRLMYLYAYLKKIKSSLSQFFKETTQKNLTAEIVRDLEIYYPESLEEQDKLAEILTTVDENIDETDKIIAECERIKKGMMQALLIKGIPGKHKKFKQTEIGVIPEDWDLLPLHALLDTCQYGIAKPLTSEKKGFPCLRMGNLSEGEILISDLKYIELNQQELETYRLFDGDILFNRTNSNKLVGKVSIFRGKESMVFAGYLIRLKTNEKMDSKFLNLYMNSDLGQGIIRRLITPGVSQANINAKNLQRILVPVPLIDEQQKIADAIFSINTKMKFEKEKSSKLSVLKQSLMQNLLSGEMRVKV